MQSASTLNDAKKSQLAKSGLRLFFVLADRWSLSQEQQLSLLGQSSRSTLKNWKEKASADINIKLNVDTLERLSLIAGIRKGVEILYPENRWTDYMHAPNAAFGGKSILDVMLLGRIGALYDVRRYLDASRGAHFG